MYINDNAYLHGPYLRVGACSIVDRVGTPVECSRLDAEGMVWTQVEVRRQPDSALDLSTC